MVTLTTAMAPATFADDPAMESRLRALRVSVDTLVGSVFYGQMLKASRRSSIRGPYGHGGRGEEVFQAQLHQILAERAGAAGRSELNEAIYRQLSAPIIRNASSTSHGVE